MEFRLPAVSPNGISASDLPYYVRWPSRDSACRAKIAYHYHTFSLLISLSTFYTRIMCPDQGLPVKQPSLRRLSVDNLHFRLSLTACRMQITYTGSTCTRSGGCDLWNIKLPIILLQCIVRQYRISIPHEKDSVGIQRDRVLLFKLLQADLLIACMVQHDI